jgi:hypothetical protein
MSYGMKLVNFRDGRREPIPRDAIVSILAQHGCCVPELREGSNEIGLPHNAVLVVKDNAVTEFGLHRRPATTQRRALLFSLINGSGSRCFLIMPGAILREVPRSISPLADSERRSPMLFMQQ